MNIVVKHTTGIEITYAIAYGIEDLGFKIIKTKNTSAPDGDGITTVSVSTKKLNINPDKIKKAILRNDEFGFSEILDIHCEDTFTPTAEELLASEKAEWTAYLERQAHLGHIDAVMLAVNNGADITYSAVLSACESGHLLVLRFLHSKGASLKDKYGFEFPLIFSAQNGQLEVVQYLVANGANVKAMKNAPLKEAQKNNHDDVVEFLLANGADDVWENIAKE